MQRHELFSAFESLGNNCEFGFVQDAAGCGSLSLFKNVGFNATEQIIDAIDASLSGMFEDGAYDFSLPDGWPDYALDCRRFGFRFHTGLPSNAADPEAQFEALLSAFRWLRSKLLQDLRDGNKMFVYRHQIQFNQPLAERLAGSIRRHGPGWLLWVRMDDRPDRCFAWVEPSAVHGLLLAGMPHLVTDSPPRVAYDAWEQIAIKAMALRRGDDPPPSPTHGPSTRLALGGTDPERSAVAAVPGSLLAVHTWIWLPSGFSSSSVDISTEGAAVGLGRPVDVSLLGCWQAVWTPVRVAPDRHTISLWLAAPDGVETTVYRTAWTVYRLGPAGTSPART